MNNACHTTDQRLPRTASIALAVLVAATVATTAYTRDGSHSVRYVCQDGDRFSVEYRDGLVRVRHGTGVFVLAQLSEGERSRFSDGNLVLLTGDGSATLRHAGPKVSENCRPFGLET